MAGNRCYRELRPAWDPDPAPAPAPSSPTSSLDQRRVRRNVWVACESCKKRKTKCSADRPSCSQCTSKGFNCVYTADPSESRNAALKRKYNELERRNDTLNEFFCAIRSMPEMQAFEVVRRIRAGASSEEVLRQFEGGYLLLQLADRPDRPDVGIPRSDMPKTRTMPTLTAMPTGLLTPENSFERILYPPVPPPDISRASSIGHKQATVEGVAGPRPLI